MSDKKNILLITNDLYPYLNANSEIVYRLANILQSSYDCDVTVLGFNRKNVYHSSNFPYCIEEVKLKELTTYYHIVNKYHNRLLRIVKLLYKPKSFFIYLRTKRHNKQDYLIREYQKGIRSIIKNKRIDCIVAFSDPFATQVAVAKNKSAIPFIAYKVDPDPSVLSQTILSNYSDYEVYEKSTNNKASYIITTKLMFDSFSRKKELSNKTIALNFPNIIKYANASKYLKRRIPLDKGSINCVFAGNLYHSIRNPRYTFNLMSVLKEYGIVFHFLGKWNDYEDQHVFSTENLVFHGSYTPDDAISFLQGCDILVNIGNSVKELMPSKILTYISLGKPILNIIKSPNCPTLEYTNRYPLALNILETEEVQQKDIEAVKTFCIENKGKQIPFEEIQKEYYTCTPEYVGKQLYDIICDVIQK